MNAVRSIIWALLPVVLLCSILTGCFGTGENVGSSKILLMGSVLKGVFSEAEIVVTDERSRVLWRGSSSANGDFNATFSKLDNDFVVTEVTMTASGMMQCDATICEVPLSSTVYHFGDQIPGSEMGAITLRNIKNIEELSEHSDDKDRHTQINGFTTLAVDLIDDQLNSGLSQEQYVQLANGSSRIVLTAFGLEVDKPINLFNLPLPDITKQTDLGNVDSIIAVLALINASQSLNISFLSNFSEALVRYLSVLDDDFAKSTLIDLQLVILSEALNIIESAQLDVDQAMVKQVIEQAVIRGIDFTKLAEAVDALAITKGHKPVVLASSQFWGGDITGSSNTDDWLWVSGINSQNNEWFQLDFESEFVATGFKIGFSESYSLESAAVEGSNDGVNWINLVNVDSTIAASDSLVLQRNVRYRVYLFNHQEPYSKYRFVSDPQDAVWLERFCLYEVSIPQNTQACEVSAEPVASSASSYKLGADNVVSADIESWWISDLASGVEEWIQLSYQDGFVATKVAISVHQNNAGDTPQIQASNNGELWKTIATIKSNSYPGEVIDDRLFRHFNLELDNTESFNHYRYYSNPTSFLWLEYLYFYD